MFLKALSIIAIDRLEAEVLFGHPFARPLAVMDLGKEQKDLPRDFWREEWEKEAIIEFHLKDPLEGYRWLALVMRDADIVAASPASEWRVRRGSAEPIPRVSGAQPPVSLGCFSLIRLF